MQKSNVIRQGFLIREAWGNIATSTLEDTTEFKEILCAPITLAIVETEFGFN